MTLHPRHRLDLRPLDLAHAASAIVSAGSADALAARVEAAWSPVGDAIACLSARAAFELYLSAAGLPPGGEVLMSALNIPDMARLLRAHGLVPVPVDLDMATLAPRPERLAALAGPRTVAVLVAHLFGGRLDLDQVARFARRRGLLLIEDGAQAFDGTVGLAHPAADLSLVSFGSIKTATALGGGLARVRDRDILDRMRSIQAGWPRQPRRAFAAKVAKLAGLHAVLSPARYGFVTSAARAAGIEVDRLVRTLTRGVPAVPDQSLRGQIALAPSAPLLAVLLRRLRADHRGRIARRAAAGEALLAELGEGAPVLGGRMPRRTHWLFAVSVADPDSLIGRLRAAGFDATRGASTIAPIPAPAGRPADTAWRCAELMAGAVFLPAYPELPVGSRQLMAAIVREHLGVAMRRAA